MVPESEQGAVVPEPEITLASLHHEVRLGFQQAHEELNHLGDDVKKINGRLRTQELWTARLQGAMALLAILGVGNVIALLLAGPS